jgi:hypothetical protein
LDFKKYKFASKIKKFMKNTEGGNIKYLIYGVVYLMAILFCCCTLHKSAISKKEKGSIVSVPIPQPPPPIVEDTSYLQGVYKTVDILPKYKDGEGALSTYIEKNLRNPYSEMDIEGTVWLSCIVEPNGKLTHIKVKRGIAGGWNNEAIRVINSTSGHLDCGYKNGKKVRTLHLIPVKCKIK